MHPDFVSVTYGASGKTRVTTRALVRRLLRETTLNPIAHLTCVGTSREEITTIVEEFLDEGVRSFLALRGDPPADQSDWQRAPGRASQTAGELVELLREIEAQRCADSPSQAVRARVRPLSVAVAAFPRGNHATGGTRAQDVASLLAKQEAGADFAITQVFFDADDYLGIVAEAREAGVTIPIIPGIIPTTDPARLLRVQELTGVPVPAATCSTCSAPPTTSSTVIAGASARASTWSTASWTAGHPASTSTRSTSTMPHLTCSRVHTSTAELGQLPTWPAGRRTRHTARPPRD